MIDFPALAGEFTTSHGAIFSVCEPQASEDLIANYRYLLWRRWSLTAPPLMVIGVNPSTATATISDPTVTRCTMRASKMGYGGLIMANLFALRSTDPKVLYSTLAPIGLPENDTALRYAAQRAGMILCAWGVHGKLHNRATEVRTMLAGLGVNLYALQLNRDGSPRHPLYVGYDTTPQLMV